MAGKTAVKEKKAQIVKKHARSNHDSGSTEVQVALLTNHINELNEHFKSRIITLAEVFSKWSDKDEDYSLI
jgi:ribosomal protein S15